jgi:hypothetical protein
MNTTLNKIVTANSSGITRNKKYSVLLKECTLEVWLESISTGPAERYTPLMTIYDLYVDFVKVKEWKPLVIKDSFKK